MAGIDYNAVVDALKLHLESDTDMRALNVYVGIELDVDTIFERLPSVVLYFDRREAPEEIQGLYAGQQTRYLLYFSVWAWHGSLESIEQAARFRNDLLSKLELALMRDRTLGGAVDKLWYEGGTMLSAERDEGDFVMGAETIVVVDVTAAL